MNSSKLGQKRDPLDPIDEGSSTKRQKLTDSPKDTALDVDQVLSGLLMQYQDSQKNPEEKKPELP